MKTIEHETEVRFNPENQTVRLHDTTCKRICDVKDWAEQRVWEVIANPDFICNTDHCQSIQTCIYDSRTRCILTMNLDNNL